MTVKKLEKDYQLYPVKIISRESLSSSIFELKAERKDIPFEPGDSVSIFLEGQNGSRTYSIASGINEPYFSFIIRLVPDGEFTPLLWNLKEGDTIFITRPYGYFRPGLDNPDKPFVFAATGTGIAPFLSYLRSYPERPPVKIFYGVRTLEDAVYAGFIAKRAPLTLALSREKKDGIFFGRITSLIELTEFSKETNFYLCGLDTMIEDITEILIQKGIPERQIYQEVFFYVPSVRKPADD